MRRSFSTIVALLLVQATFLTASATAQTAPPAFSIVGQATFSDAVGNDVPSPDGEVVIYDGTGPQQKTNLDESKIVAKTVTDAEGRYAFLGLTLDPASSYTVIGFDKDFRRAAATLLSLTGASTIANLKLQSLTHADLAGTGQAYYASRPVFFVTDRATSTDPKVPAFANDRSRPFSATYGTSTVNLQLTTAECGKLSPPWGACKLRSTTTPTIGTEQPMVSAAFLAAVKKAVDASKTRRVVVFVHGFNTSFEGAMQGAGKLAERLEPYDGPVVAFSWPSRSELALYGADLNNAEFASDHLRELLTALVTTLGSGKVDIVAHSMGNHVLAYALHSMEIGHSVGDGAFHNIVLAAADVDSDEFRSYATAFRPMASSWTLYASSHDQAMLISRCLNGEYFRIGTWVTPTPPVPGMELVDTSPIGGDFSGHGYFLGSDIVAQDLAAVVDDNPAQRTAVPLATGELRIGSGPPPFAFQAVSTVQARACDGVYVLLKELAL